MSLQKGCGSGRGTLRLAAPVLRSNPFRALRLSPLLEGPPKALRSFEHAQRVAEASSAKTPVIEREPAEPGATNTAAAPVRGSARTTPPSPSRPTNSVPSRAEVMLSGNARSPGSAIDDGPAAAVIQRADENSAPASTACVWRDRDGGEQLAIDP